MRKIIIIIFVTMLCASNVFGATYYIKNGGSDVADGLTDGTAWATLDKIRTTAGNDHTFYLNRGDTWISTATEDYASIHLDSRTGITVEPYGSGADPIINNLALDDPTPDENYPNYNCVEIMGVSSGNTITGLDLLGAEDTSVIYIHSTNNTGNTIDACDLSGTGFNTDDEASLISVNSSSTFTNCVIDAVTNATNGYRKQVNGDGGNGTMGDITFISCEFIGCYTEGLFVKELAGGSTITIDKCFFRDPNAASLTFTYRRMSVFRSMDYGDVTLKITNSVYSFVSGPSGGSSMIEAYAGGPQNWIINNNTFVAINNVEAIDVAGRDLELYNNIFYNMSSPAIDDIADFTGTTDCQNNVFYLTTKDTCGTDTNNVFTNPNLEDPTMGSDIASDASITALSTNSIDSGTGSAGVGNIPAVDYAGDTRVDPPDIGAYEYTTSTSPALACQADDTTANDSYPFTATYGLESGRTVASCTWSIEGGSSGSCTATGGNITGTATGLSIGDNVITLSLTDSEAEIGICNFTVARTAITSTSLSGCDLSGVEM